jgi:hypothetical protein
MLKLMPLRPNPHRNQEATGFHQRMQLHALQQIGRSLGLFSSVGSQHRGDDEGYSREEKDDPAAELQFCPNCGSTTHFTLTAGAVAKFGNIQLCVWRMRGILPK